jgi:hypothetical protein
VKRGLGPLETVLASRSLRSVTGGMRAGSQLGHSQGTNRQLFREGVRIELIEVNHD